MPAPLSIIIPTLNAEADLPGCLASLAPGIATGLIREVIVLDGGSQDKTILPAHQSGARVICGCRGRGRQLRAGAFNAKGDWLLFLHADTWLSETWAEAVKALIAGGTNEAGYFRLAYRSEAKAARWLEGRANRRAKVFGLPYGDQGLVVSRALYNSVGGFEDVPLMEDVGIVRRLGKKRLVELDATAHTSADKYERDGWRKRAYSNAWLMTRYLLGASPDKLAKAYT